VSQEEYAKFHEKVPWVNLHVELTGIINKPLLLHLVGCLYYLYVIIVFETC